MMKRFFLFFICFFLFATATVSAATATSTSPLVNLRDIRMESHGKDVVLVGETVSISAWFYNQRSGSLVHPMWWPDPRMQNVFLEPGVLGVTTTIEEPGDYVLFYAEMKGTSDAMPGAIINVLYVKMVQVMPSRGQPPGDPVVRLQLPTHTASVEIKDSVSRTRYFRATGHIDLVVPRGTTKFLRINGRNHAVIVE